jgi:undecaprenyl-diphosphatase
MSPPIARCICRRKSLFHEPLIKLVPAPVGPHAWFKGSAYQSFPSGEVTLQASFVTPFVANFGRQDPWIWALEALPVYDAFARLKSRAHWQTDVIAGWALGMGVGYWSTTRAVPLSAQALPRGLSVGFSKRF